MEEGEGSRRYWLWGALILGWWTVNGFATASQYHLMRGAAGDPIPWSYALTTAMATAYLWIPITVLALWLTWRYPIERERWASRLGVHLPVALAVPLFRAGAVQVLNPWIGWYPELPSFPTVLLANFVNNFFFYWMLLGVAHALHYAQRSRHREQLADCLRTELVQAQLHALRAQLHPHFLFNTLNTISSLVHQDADAAERMIARLSELLRHTLDRVGAQEVELREELEFVEAYLEIEQTRFEDRLHVRWEIDPQTLDARVPPLILQPLVENSIRHGIAPRSAPGTVEIASERQNGNLYLCVYDDGVGLKVESPRTGKGVGIASTRARLEQMYGERHQFQLGPAPQGGVLAEVTLPFRTTGG